MQDSLAVGLKKDLFVQLAFALFGHLIGFDAQKRTLCKSVGFVVSPEGDFFLISRKTAAIDNMDLEQEVLLNILKEGKSVSDMWDIQVHGIAKIITHMDEEIVKQAKQLFEDKSPYLGSIAFLDMGKDYLLFKIEPREIFFQNLKSERDGKPGYTLSL